MTRLTATVMLAALLPIAMLRAVAAADDEKPEKPAAENLSSASKTGKATAEQAQQAPAEKRPEWSNAIGGLQFRLVAPRTAFQTWELPTLIVEARNAGNEKFTAEMMDQQVIDPSKRAGLRFMFNDEHRSAQVFNIPRVPEVRVDWKKLIGLIPGESLTLTATLIGTRGTPNLAQPNPLVPGRYMVGLGMLSRKLATNSVTLDVLPPGVGNQAELAGQLKTYEVEGKTIEAGFVPNKTTVVEGEPMLVNFVVQNGGEKPFAFEIGGRPGGPRNDRFKIAVVNGDNESLYDPLNERDASGNNRATVTGARDMTVETLDLRKYRRFPGPGKYRVRCDFVITPDIAQANQGFSIPVQASYELTILAREPENVQRVLDEWLTLADQTAAWPLDELVERISSFGKDSAVPGLERMGLKGNAEHRIAAAKGLGRIGSARALDALSQMAHDPSADVQAAAITAIGAVVQAATHADESGRKTAATARAQMKGELVVAALIERFATSDLEVRAAMLRTMGNNRSPRAFDIIVESLASKNELIWRAALDAIVNFPVEKAAAALRPYAQNDPNMDFREAVVGKLAESLMLPIEMEWLMPVIKSRKLGNSLGDAPRLMQTRGGEKAVPALLGCLDFDNPSVRSYYNLAIIDQQLVCRGALAIPWHGDPNRDGSAEETDENRRTLRIIKAWFEYCQTHPDAVAPPPMLNVLELEKTWGEPVDNYSIHARVDHTPWPAGLPQVVSVLEREKPKGLLRFSSDPEAVEVEINSQWYTLAKDADLKVCGNWNARRGNASLSVQLDGRWRRKMDGQPLELKPGKYTVRVALGRVAAEKRVELAISKPLTFEVIPTDP